MKNRPTPQDWEFALLHGLPRPKVSMEDLIAYWQKNGFRREVIEVLRGEYIQWENRAKLQKRN